MPTYDYACTSCRQTFEIFHSMTEAARKKCPACGKNTLERQLGTGGAIIFKGSGFYQTDYRSEGYKKAADAEKPADSKPAVKDAKPAESVPAEKPAKSSSESKPRGRASGKKD
jgi:putative FmdB family regulatory protein